jgi:hypothetical protein
MGSEFRADLRQQPKSSGATGGVARWIRRIKPAPGRPPRPRLPAVSKHWLLRPTLAPGGVVDVAVHSDGLAALALLARTQTPARAVNRRFMAQLVREFRNIQDPDAVRVEIGGYPVGYIAREEAPWFHPVVGELARHGRPATCRAMVTGGSQWGDGGDDPFAVVLDVSVPLRMNPADAPLLPGGSEVDVANTDGCHDALAVLLGESDGPVAALATLTTADYSKVDIYIGGVLVGDLAPLMSARYLPAVMDVWAAGEVPTSGAVIARADSGIEVTLDLWLPDA